MSAPAVEQAADEWAVDGLEIIGGEVQAHLDGVYLPNGCATVVSDRGRVRRRNRCGRQTVD